jgi:capsular exopolysaccharide synthesis family protein
VKAAKPIKSILVSAAGSGEGTTFTAVNIATALALMGRQIVLVDANMEHGIVHRFFGHAGQPGFTDLVRNLSLMAKATFKSELIPNMTIIPAGSLKEEHDVIAREKLGGLIEKIGIKIDLIIFDGPPINQVNARIIASKVDGVLLVLRAHHTRAGDLRAGLELLKLSGASIFGTVISRVSRNEKGYFI